MRRPAGLGLASVLLMATVVLVAAGALLELTGATLSVSRAGAATAELQQAALAGLGEARALLSRTPDWTTAAAVVPPEPRSFGSGASYRLEVLEAPAANRCTVRATGFRDGVETSVTAVLRRRNTTFVGTVGLDKVKIADLAKLDSYDSRLAAYDPNDPRERATVLTNATAADRIRLLDAVQVRGDARFGPGGSGVVERNPGALLTGEEKALRTAFQAPAAGAYGPPSGTSQGDRLLVLGSAVDLAPGVYGAVDVPMMATIRLSAGRYSFRRLILGPGARLVTSASAAEPTHLFVDGDIHVHQAAVNGGGDPAALLLYGTAAGAGIPMDDEALDDLLSTQATESGQDAKLVLDARPDLHLHGDAQLSAAVYAPAYMIHAGGTSEITGALVGAVTHLHQNAQFHFDRALEDVPDPVKVGDVIVVSLERR